jgi:hypothetical protein
VKSLLVLLLVGSSLPACYDPETTDCTVTCGAPDECASGQICDPDGYCAVPEVAGQCVDKTVEKVALEIHIDGDGTVSLDGVGDCDSRTAKDRTCSFAIAPNQSRRLRALPNGEKDFKEWSSACSGDSATCELTPVMELTRVGAKFE